MYVAHNVCEKPPKLRRKAIVIFYARIIAVVVLSVCLSVCPFWCLSRLGTEPGPGEIQTPGFAGMIVHSLYFLATKFRGAGYVKNPL